MDAPAGHYTIDDLEFVILELDTNPRVATLDTICGGTPEQITARRRQMAEYIIAGVSQDARTLRILAASADGDVVKAVAGNLLTPPDVLAWLARTSRDAVVLAIVCKHPALSDDDIAELAMLGGWFVRGAILRHGRCPQWVIDQAATDESPWVRGAAAQHPSTYPDTLLMLAQDADEGVRAAAARRSSLPTEILRTLASDPDLYVRAAVASNPSTPADVLDVLSADEESWVRLHLADHPHLPLGAALRLAADTAETVRRGLARNEHCPAGALIVLARRRGGVLVDVARHPACPPELLARLRRDPARYVRDAAHAAAA